MIVMKMACFLFELRTNFYNNINISVGFTFSLNIITLVTDMCLF